MKATDLLRRQHRDVETLFEKLLKSDDVRTRRALYGEISAILECHLTIEEESFYPTYRKAVSEAGEVLKAFEEHHAIDLLLEELPKADPAAETYLAKMKVLEELVALHFREEELSMFVDAERRLSGSVLEEIGREMALRADELAH